MRLPDVEAILDSLKDFQRNTVDYAFRRLWTDPDATRKFLVADEVGLGKTMIAKGVIAKTIHELHDKVERIDIVYICSNGQIAAQNLNRLRDVIDESAGSTMVLPNRLTMLATATSALKNQKVNFISLTPGTSFSTRGTLGTADERILIYWILAELWGRREVAANRWFRFFEGRMDSDNFRYRLRERQTQPLDPDIVADFGRRLQTKPGPEGGTLEDELRACVAKLNYRRGPLRPNSSDPEDPDSKLSASRAGLMGRLRSELALASVDALEPDLVILDEFQRFKDLLTTDDQESEVSQLADAVFNHRDSRTLLLSATPYKMYTLPDEPEGDDHYADFTRTVKFLAGEDQARDITENLKILRETLVIDGDIATAHEAKARAEAGLRTVMCRTERMSATPENDNMIREVEMPGVSLSAEDVRVWRSMDSITKAIDHPDAFEYWRSMPYPLSLMDSDSYVFNRKFREAVSDADPLIRSVVADGHGFLSWDDIRTYRRLDPGNAKARGMVADVLDRGVWKLLWLPPSLPYYPLSGAYAESCDFTKRLVFSAWNVVPKAISMILSYEAERRAMEQAHSALNYDQHEKIATPLQYKLRDGEPATMSLFALTYPSTVLARIGDPLSLAREWGRFDVPTAEIIAVVRDRVAEVLSPLTEDAPVEGRADQSWYWAAPILLDRLSETADQNEFEEILGSTVSEDTESDTVSAFSAHRDRLVSVDFMQLGRVPEDLINVLATVALAGPAVASLRALSRSCGGDEALASPELRMQSITIARSFRRLFNSPEAVAVLRGGETEDRYWQTVVQHCLDGCLQSVLDEYFHNLVESLSLQNMDDISRAQNLTAECRSTLGLNTVSNVFDEYRVGEDGTLLTDSHRIRLNVATRLGQVVTDGKKVEREASVQKAFNSPFRPFVLASTSVGQEGLDFHTYSHAIVHWNLPTNPVDLEQREGRVHRYKGHAVRKNIAIQHGAEALWSTVDDPWHALFSAAEAQRPDDESELTPFWVYTVPGGAVIERYVPVMPMSKESRKYQRLLRSVAGYRMVIGQPRQEDLLRYLGSKELDPAQLAINLQPPLG